MNQRCSTEKVALKNSAILRKKPPVLESLLNKIVGLKVTSLLKRDSTTADFLRILRNF